MKLLLALLLVLGTKDFFHHLFLFTVSMIRQINICQIHQLHSLLSIPVIILLPYIQYIVSRNTWVPTQKQAVSSDVNTRGRQIGSSWRDLYFTVEFTMKSRWGTATSSRCCRSSRNPVRSFGPIHLLSGCCSRVPWRRKCKRTRKGGTSRATMLSRPPLSC